MKKLFMALFMSVMALGLSMGEAEAKRLGGGSSFGMKRQAVQPSRPAQQAAPATPKAPAAAPAATPKRNWMGPIAGLAAGLGLAALFSHLGLGAEMANIVMIGLLLMAALFIFRMLFRRNASTVQSPGMQYAGAGDAANAAPRAATEMPFASASEGLANAWVEALACGTPIVITAAGGAGDVVCSAAAGRIVARDAEAFRAAIADLLAAPPAPHDTRQAALGFTWEANRAALYDHLAGLVSASSSSS